MEEHIANDVNYGKYLHCKDGLGTGQKGDVGKIEFNGPVSGDGEELSCSILNESSCSINKDVPEKSNYAKNSEIDRKEIVNVVTTNNSSHSSIVEDDGAKEISKPCTSSNLYEAQNGFGAVADTKQINYFEDMRKFEQSSQSCDGDGNLKGPMGWIIRQISHDVDPRNVISQVMPGVTLPHYVDPMTLWKVVWEILTEPKRRTNLDHVSTLDDVVRLIGSCTKIIILTGAGVSVSCGIPDFRSRDGIYARLSKDFPDLPDPQSMFDIHYFRRDQRPFYKFAKEIYPGQFKPSLSHRFIAAVDRKKKLLRNYTQNIDTLEQVAGIERVVQCHGSFATASCTKCKHQVTSEEIRGKIFNQIIPKCPVCAEDENSLAVMKPDIIFFGEGLPNVFYEKLDTDKLEADLLIVIGSSLKVRPVALIPDYLKPDVPQILINREPLDHFNFDVELLGNCDDVICEICRRLGEEWSDVIEGHEMPPLDKEAMYKILESLSDTENEESDETEDNNGVATDNKIGVAIDNKDGVAIDNKSDVAINNKDVVAIENKDGGHQTINDVKSSDEDRLRSEEKISFAEEGNIASVYKGSLLKNNCDKPIWSSTGSNTRPFTKDEPLKTVTGSDVEGESSSIVVDAALVSSNVSVQQAQGSCTERDTNSEHGNNKNKETIFVDHGVKIASVESENSKDRGITDVDQRVSDETSSEDKVRQNRCEEQLKINDRKRSYEVHVKDDGMLESAPLGSCKKEDLLDASEKKTDQCITSLHPDIQEQSVLAAGSEATTVSKSDNIKNVEIRTDNNEPKRLKLDVSLSQPNSSTNTVCQTERNLEASLEIAVNIVEGIPTSSSDLNTQANQVVDVHKKTFTELTARPKSPKCSKEFLRHEMEEQDLCYLFVPPNRYIFHGAEINSSFAPHERHFDVGSDEEDEDMEIIVPNRPSISENQNLESGKVGDI